MSHYKCNILLAAQAFLWLPSNSAAFASVVVGGTAPLKMSQSGNGLITAPPSEPTLQQEMRRKLRWKRCSACEGQVKAAAHRLHSRTGKPFIEAAPTFIKLKIKVRSQRLQMDDNVVLVRLGVVIWCKCCFSINTIFGLAQNVSK